MRLGKIIKPAAPMLAAVLLGLFMASDASAIKDSYSATIVFNDNGFESSIKVYLSGTNVRLEPDMSYEPVTIASKDKNYIIQYDREQGTYTMDIYRQSDLPPIVAPGRMLERQNLGADKVGDVDCAKSMYEVQDDDGDKHKEIRWYDTASFRLMKVQAEDESWSYTLTEISSGSQDPALFEPPEGKLEGEAPGGDEYGDEEYGDEEYGDEYDEDSGYGDESDEGSDDEYGDEYDEGEEEE